MKDREMLELAAKAAGYDASAGCSDMGVWCNCGAGGCYSYWNPLTDDGDALRLAVKLGMIVNCIHDELMAEEPIISKVIAWEKRHNDDPYAATRRAIVRAAAEIGKGMK